MNYIKIGRIVDTHGIKGELRIKSDFDKKELVFVPDFKLYIGKEYIEEVIVTYRHHKDFEMVTLKGYSNINEVLKYLKNDVYINRDDLKLDEEDYLLDELIGLDVIFLDDVVGKIEDIVDSGNKNILLEVRGEKKFYIPNNDNFIKEVDIKNKKVIVENIKGLMM